MRVALLYPFWRNFPPKKTEYAMEIVGLELARRLAERGIETTLYSEGERLGWATVVDLGVEHRRVPRVLDAAARRALDVRTRLALATGRADPRLPENASALFKLSYGFLSAWDMRRRALDVAHISIFDQLVPIVHRVSPRTRIVLHMHDHKQVYREPEVTKRRLGQADLIVGCSEFVTRNVAQAFPELASRCRAVLNAVDCELFRPAPEARESGRKRLLFVGRLAPEKGVHTVLEAFELVLDRHPDAELVVVGPESVAPLREVDLAGHDPRFDGLRHFYTDPAGYHRHLRALLSPAAERRVRFVSSASHQELPHVYQDADVFLFPSIWDEPFGLPVIEAMACGLPVVATRVGGIAETVEAGATGVLVEPGDVAALAREVVRLLDDGEARAALGAAARARAEKHFSWSRRVDEWIGVYEGAVAS